MNPFQLLLVGMVLEGTVLLFEGITGVVADTYGRRISVIIGVFVVGGGMALQGAVLPAESLMPFIPMLGWLLAAQVLFGLGHTFVSGAETAWIVDEIGEERMASLFLKSSRISQAAGLAGIGLGVWLYQLSPGLPLVSVGLLYGLLGVFLIAVMKETGFQRNAAPAGVAPWTEMAQTWLSGARFIRNQPILIFMLIVTVFTGAASEGYDRLWGAHLIREIGFPAHIPLSMAAWFGLIAAISALLSMAVLGLAERRLTISGPRAAALILLVLTALRVGAVLAVALAPGFIWAFAALLLAEVVRSLSHPIYETWLNQHIGSGSRATVLSMMGQSDALGQIAGGPFVGWVGSRLSIRASLTVAALLLSPILPVFARVLVRGKPAKEPEQAS